MCPNGPGGQPDPLSLPRFLATLNHLEQGMEPRSLETPKEEVSLSIPLPELPLQVSHLVLCLSSRDRNPAPRSRRTDFLAIKGITPAQCLFVQTEQVLVYCPSRLRMQSESVELGMPSITFGLVRQDGLCQQGFPPACDKPAGIKIARVQTPQSHGCASLRSQIPRANPRRGVPLTQWLQNIRVSINFSMETVSYCACSMWFFFFVWRNDDGGTSCGSVMRGFPDRPLKLQFS